MPETYGLPEDEEEGPSYEERLTEAFAGNGIVRRMVLYCVTGFALAVTVYIDGVFGMLIGALGLIALLLLSMTDHGLSS